MPSTAEMLAERDPAGEVVGWMRAIAELLEVAKTKRPDLAAAQAQVRAAESKTL